VNWLNKPVTWKWYLGIMAASFAIGLLIPRRAPQMPKGVDQ
jgi:hypothetical protein